MAMGGMYAQTHWNFYKIIETSGVILRQSKDRVNLIRLELRQTANEKEDLPDVIKAYLPKQ